MRLRIIRSCPPAAGADSLREDDVIIAIDGKPVGDDFTVRWGRVLGFIFDFTVRWQGPPPG